MFRCGEDEFGFGGGTLDFGGGPQSSDGLGPPARQRLKVPVSILTGFLGAGKTTVVQHILRNRAGLKVGVVVNDVAEANVDSAVLDMQDADGVVGLENGCVCCSARDDLFARLGELAGSDGLSKLDRPWDRLVVECSGVAEPEPIARELEAMAQRGDPVMQQIFLAGVICVVDASSFWDQYNSPDGALEGASQPVSVLLACQLESADTIVINKADLVSEADLHRLQGLLAAIAPRARRLVASHGAIPLRELLPAEPMGLEMPAYVPSLASRHAVAVAHAEAGGGRGHAGGGGVEHGCGHGHSHEHGDCQEHGHDHGGGKEPPRHDRFGIASFVYRGAGGRAFDPALLASAARLLPIAAADICFGAASSAAPARDEPGEGSATGGPFRGVLRSKGFVRVASVDGPLYWSHAGRRLEVSEVQPRQDAARGSACPHLRAGGQELVFIGTGMDEAAIRAVLDACLIPADGLQAGSSL